MTKKRPPKKTDSLELRIDPETNERFQVACREEGKAASKVIRDFVAAYADGDKRAFAKLKESPIMRFLTTTRGRMAAVTAAIALGTAVAGPAAADPRAEALFIWLDRNGDAGLSQEEFATPPDSVPSSQWGLEISATTIEVPDVDEPGDAMFARLDADGDGLLSLDELDRSVIMQTAVNGNVLDADLDGDGRLNADEMIARIMQNGADASREAVKGVVLMTRALIAAHDKDEDGALNAEEIAAI